MPSRRCRRRSPASTTTDAARRHRWHAASGSTPNSSVAVSPGPGSRRPSWSRPAGSRCAGTVAAKVAAMVDPADPVRGARRRSDDRVRVAGRPQTRRRAGGVHARPGWPSAGRRCLDAGASTGGFTDVLLRAGAREVVAVDVGYGQLAWSIRTDERVRVHDRTNVRSLTPDDIGGPADLIVADLSFISLRLVLDALVACLGPDGDLVPMVKPQFEVGKERVGSGGVVRDPALRADAVLDVAERGQPRTRRRRRGDQPAAGPVGQRRVLPLAAAGPSRGHRRRRSGAWSRPA